MKELALAESARGAGDSGGQELAQGDDLTAVRKPYNWKLARREIVLGERTILMGVLNVTPDSFSDGGKYAEPDRAFARAVELEEQGADIIDIGAESTRPGSSRISAAVEMQRLVPVLKRLKDRLTIPISVDTYKAEIAERAIDLGAEIINDPSGLTIRAAPGASDLEPQRRADRQSHAGTSRNLGEARTDARSPGNDRARSRRRRQPRAACGDR